MKKVSQSMILNGYDATVRHLPLTGGISVKSLLTPASTLVTFTHQLISSTQFRICARAYVDPANPGTWTDLEAVWHGAGESTGTAYAVTVDLTAGSLLTNKQYVQIGVAYKTAGEVETTIAVTLS